MLNFQWLGLFAVLAGGICQGSFMFPMKRARQWSWENTWLVFAIWAYLLSPWGIVFASVSNPFRILAATPPTTLLLVGLFGFTWGISAVSFGIGVSAVGMSLGFAIIAGLAAFTGTVIPFIFLQTHAPSPWRIAVSSIALILMLAGVAVCSLSGRWKESKPEKDGILSYRKGLLVCVVSGIMSSSGNLGFVSGEVIVRNAQAMGVPGYLAPNLVWACLCVFMFLFNAGYSVLRMRRNRTAANFLRAGSGWNWTLGALMGILWMGGFFLYGAGAGKLGHLGPSLGWGILMSTMVMTANILGILSGEWRGAPSSARRRLGQGLLLLFVAITMLGYANSLR